MAIKRFNGYEEAKAYTAYTRELPRGGYVCKILDAVVTENQYGQSIKILFDIEEGDFKGYYQQKYDAKDHADKKWPGVFLLSVPNDDGTERDGWTKNKFKTFIVSLEESNPGYHFDWDESKFKGKLVGLIFNLRQYEFNGSTGFAPNAAKSASVEAIRSGKYKIPKDRMLPGHENDHPLGAAFTVVETEDMPF